ncbi:DUF397 domain-containing protein [Nocardia terpenica]|uniref:DUF397 domain-containing protein n=1 Tax=Nocardia terpenica TaxID=455432 RepID=A0A6G9ZEV3_9NOCA|nr:DUF397 domain-containing protein [Nocardia terpenica]QIS24052.1 DUF397 domain-containing protein [Nocardia terpenica]
MHLVRAGTDAKWFKSSRSSGKDACVEVAHLGGGLVGMRDSKDPAGPALVFTPAEWDAFTAGVKDGEFDRI